MLKYLNSINKMTKTVEMSAMKDRKKDDVDFVFEKLLRDRSLSSDDDFDISEDDDDDLHPNQKYKKTRTMKERINNLTLSSDEDFNTTLDDDIHPSPMVTINSAARHTLRKFPITDDLGNCFLLRNSKVPLKYKSILKNLKIEISWKIPPYQQRKRIYKDRSLRTEEENNIKTGKFAPSEDAFILKNWDEFCLKYRLEGIHITSLLYCNLLRTSTKIDLLRLLARNVKRTLQSVEKRVLIILGSKYPAKYTFMELEIVRNYYFSSCRASYGHFKRDLSFLLSRFGYPFLHILHRAKSYHYFHQIDSNLITTIINRLLSYFEFHENFPHAYYDIFCRIQWVYILKKSSKSKTSVEADVAPAMLNKFWIYQLSSQILQTKPLHLNHLLVKLIRILYQRNYNHWVSIRWKSIAEEFDKIRPEMLCYQFMIYVVSHVPKLCLLSYRETIQILYCYFMPELINSPGKILPVIPLQEEQRNIFVRLWYRHVEYHSQEKCTHLN